MGEKKSFPITLIRAPTVVGASRLSVKLNVVGHGVVMVNSYGVFEPIPKPTAQIYSFLNHLVSL
jgi:hypothetical protein